MTIHFIAVLMLTLFVSACSDKTEQLNKDFGKPQVRDRIVEAEDPLANYFLNKVKPILENRCVVCHGCYDSPCQLKLSSVEGIDRGFSPELVYGLRLSEMESTRLFIDAENTQQWRDKEKPFKPVLNEREQIPEANLQGSVLYQMLAQKNAHPLPADVSVLPDSFDFSLDRKQQCPSIETIGKYQKDFPLAGMPYGFPNINRSEFKTIQTWVEQGAPMAQPPAITDSLQQRINDWETLVNREGNKAKLINRYIYEHL
ncbi:MAG TPA: fatty acid cis/trans isomerase, partial [Psychromonas sp.]